MQRFAADVNVACFFAQTCAAAARAGTVILVLAQFFAHGFAVGFAVAAFEIGDDALEGVAAVEGGAAFGQVGEINDFFARAVQHDFFDFFRQSFPSDVDIKFIMMRQRLNHLEIELVALVPAVNRARCQ